jgi:hypothetical protein
MTYERTQLRVDGETAVVETYPRQVDDVPLEYRLRRADNAWVLKQPRHHYTDHVLNYAQQELEGRVVEVCLPVTQTSLPDHTTGHPTDVGRATSTVSSD